MTEEDFPDIEQVTAEPVFQGWLSQDELCARLGIGPDLLEVCLQWDIIHPPESSSQGIPLFPDWALDRLCSGLRLHRDLGVNWAGVSIILDLLERIQELESDVNRSHPFQT